MQAIGRHPTKDALFDILSLANQLHRSKSTIPDGPEPGKIYFSENAAPDLLEEGEAILHREVDRYNLSLSKNELLTTTSNEYTLEEEIQIPELQGNNEQVNELFSQAQEAAAVISNLSELCL